MKKKRIIASIIVVLSTGFVIYYASSQEYGVLDNSDISPNEYITTMSKEPNMDTSDLPDYEVLSSYSSSSAGGHRETDIDVAVYKNQYSEEMYKRIEDDHNRLNSVPETLTINLYRSDTEYSKGIKPYTVIYIDYTNDIREITVNPF